MSESLTILVDMDGVLANFDAEVINRIREQYPHIPIVESRPNIRIPDDYPEHRALIRGILDQPGFFYSLPLMEHAIEGYERIVDLGYNPRICSSPVRTNPTSIPEKLAWLERHFAPIFGSYVVEQAIITEDKHLFDGRALIDDNPIIKSAGEASWKHIIFDSPHNQRSTGLRLYGWLDQRLPELLEMAKS